MYKYLQKKMMKTMYKLFTKKPKKLFNYPIPTTSHLYVTMSLSEIEIK